MICGAGMAVESSTGVMWRRRICLQIAVAYLDNDQQDPTSSMIKGLLAPLVNSIQTAAAQEGVYEEVKAEIAQTGEEEEPSPSVEEVEVAPNASPETIGDTGLTNDSPNASPLPPDSLHHQVSSWQPSVDRSAASHDAAASTARPMSRNALKNLLHK